jgi:hypothetical protein
MNTVTSAIPPAQPSADQPPARPAQDPPPADQVMPPESQNLIAGRPPAQTQPNQMDAANHIRHLMRSTNPITDPVTTSELRQVKQTLESLPQSQVNTAFTQLTDAEIKNITWEMQAPGVGDYGGLSADERRDVIANLSQKLDAKNFERFASAYGSAEEIASVLTSPGSKATTDAKIGFLSAFDNRDDMYVDEPSAMASVLSSMRGDQAGLQRALGKDGVLDATELSRILRPGLGDYAMPNPDGSRHVVYSNPRQFNAVMDAAASSNSPEVKANVFQASSTVLGELQTNGNQPSSPPEVRLMASIVGAKMSTLLRSDPNGIVRTLDHRNDPGKGMSEWTEQMLRDNKTGDIAEVIHSLRLGPQGSNPMRDPNVFLRDLPRARTLGYMLGATAAGLENLKVDAKAQAQIVEQFAGFVPGRFPISKLGVDTIKVFNRNIAAVVANVHEGKINAATGLLHIAVDGIRPDTQEGAGILDAIETRRNTVYVNVNLER